MTKTVPDLATPSLTETTQSMQTQLDQFNAFVAAPPRKLDADEYMANDLDGSTEGLLGSGNLNFLMMQAGQTDESMSNAHPFGVNAEQIIADAIAAVSANAMSPMAGAGNAFDTAMDRPFSLSGDQLGGIDGGPGGGQTNNTAGTLGASSYAANAHSASPFSDVTNFSSSSSTADIRPAIHGNDGSNGTSGTSGTSGTNGTNGMDGTPGGDTTIINEAPITNIYDTINNTVNNVTDITENVFDATTNIFDTVNNIFNNIFDGGDLGPVGISLDATLDDITNIALDIISGDNIINVLDEIVDISPILTPVEGLLGNLLSSTSLDVILNPFQYDNSPNDFDLHIGTDINLLGIEIPPLAVDVPLDLVEGLLGDIDINLNLTDDLLDAGGILGGLLGGGNGDTDLALGNIGAINLSPVNDIVSGIVNPIENLVGDIDIAGNIGLGLLGVDADAGGTDTDIHLPIDIDLIDSDLLNQGIDISLDPLENIIGDVDLDLGVATNLLGNVADGLIDNLPGGTGEHNILSDAGDILSDVAGNLLPFGGDPSDTDVSLDIVQDTLGFDLLGSGTDAVLDPVESIVGDIDLTSGIDLFNQGDFNAASDTDLSIDIDFVDIGLPPVDLDIPLDAVESLTGDLDLNLSVSEDLAQGLGDTLENVIDGPLVPDAVEDVTHLLDDLGNATGGLADILDGDGFEDIHNLVSDLPIIGGNEETDIFSDLMNGVNDVVTGALDLLGTVSGGDASSLDLGGALSGGGGSLGGLDSITSWTENVLPDTGGLLGGGLESAITSILPDPVSTSPVSILPTIPIIPVVPPVTNLFGGLGGHGGGHHGGLFG